MSVRTLQRTDGAMFYCTFTYWNWLHLIEATALYDRIYNWMHLAQAKGFRFTGYVIMPNHMHLMVWAPEGSSINTLLSNAKRFLTYDMIARLQEQGNSPLLEQLRQGVRGGDAARGQKHRGLATSSDIRECFDEAMIEQKLDYMHGNPVSDHWTLVADYLDYPHSSAAFYERSRSGPAPLVHYHEIMDG